MTKNDTIWLAKYGGNIYLNSALTLDSSARNIEAMNYVITYLYRYAIANDYTHPYFPAIE